MIGYWIQCSFTLWLAIGNKSLPHNMDAVCMVIAVEETVVVTGVPQHYYVDCTKAIGWLDTDHPAKFWINKEQCNG